MQGAALEPVVPISPTQHRAAAGGFTHVRAPVVHRGYARPLRPLDPTRVCRVGTPLQATLVLLLVANAAGRAAAASVPVRPCPDEVALTVPGALHEAAGIARAPMSTEYDEMRKAYYQYIAHRCAPPESAIERAVMQVGDAVVGVVELEVLGPDGVVAIHAGADALDLAADALEGKPLDMTLLEDALFAQGGIKPAGEPVIAPREPALPAHVSRPQSSIRIFDRAARAIGRGTALPAEWLLDAPPDPPGLLRYRDPLTGQAGLALQVDGRFYAAQPVGEYDLVVAGQVLEHRDGLYWLREG